MAHPAETAPKATMAFGSARLTPEEADRLASTIRPSWELDDAPFTGPGTLSEEDLRALHGGGIHPAVRAMAQDGPSRSQATNGSHPPPPATPSREPESSVILDPALVAELLPLDPRPAPTVRPGATIIGLAAAVRPDPTPDTARALTTSPSLSLQLHPTPRRPVAPAFHFSPPGTVQARPGALAADEAHPRKPKTALWVALGLGGVAVVGLVAWIASSSGSSVAPAAPTATTTATADKAATTLAPVPPAASLQPAPTAEVPPPATAAAAPPVSSVAPTPVTDLPHVAPVPPRWTAAAVPRGNYPAASPPPRPAAKPKSGQTIVRDVPF
jgi:hypothetical protein